MLKYIFKRLILTIFTLFSILTICFILIKLLPPLVFENSQLEEIVKKRLEALGYNKPIMVQYGIYLRNIFLHWDWGTSFKIDYLASASVVVTDRLLPSILVSLYPLLIATPLGILLGAFMAFRRNKPSDHVLSVIVVICISIPAFVMGFILQYFLGYKLGLEITIYSLKEAGNSWFSPKMFYSMILPILSLAIGIIASFARRTRAELIEVLTNDYMLLARTKGLTHSQAILRHALKNAMVPILPGVIISFVGIIEGAPLTERIFGIPGIGYLMIDAINFRDYDVFMMTIAFFVGIGLLANILYDISFSFIDPRIRMGAKK